jgi:hypothetical protein
MATKKSFSKIISRLTSSQAEQTAEGLDRLAQENPERREVLQRNAARFAALAKRRARHETLKQMH